MTMKAVFEFFDASGTSIGAGTMPTGGVYYVKAGSELQAALNGQNPNFGGAGGVAVGIIHTDYDPGAQTDADTTTAKFDYLKVVSLDPAPNAAPTVGEQIAAQAADEDAAFSFTVPADAFADDGGAANLTLAATLADGTALPAWLSFDPGTGAFSGTPADGDVGALSVRVTATDGGNLSAEQVFALIVTNTNDAPVAGAALATAAANVGAPFSYALPAGAFVDVDAGDTLTYTAELAGGDPLPAWLSIDAATGALSGTPDAGTDLSVVITATDAAGATAEQVLAIDVSTEPPAEQSPVTIEAEDFTGLAAATRFVASGLGLASGDEVIQLRAKQTGSVSTDLSSVDQGTYKLRLDYLDETDGVGTITVTVDGVIIGTFDLDGVNGTQLYPGATTGSTTQRGNFRQIELATEFEVDAGSVLTIEAVARGGEFIRIDSVTLIPTTIAIGNEAPTVTLENLVVSLAENTDTSTAIKLADIVIDDDGQGTNVLSLSGADAQHFQIVGDALFLKADVALDFETKSAFDVTVEVDDAAIAGGPESSAPFTLGVTDVAENEAPTAVALTNAVASIAEDVDTSQPIKVADIVVSDDGLGTNGLALSGADAGLFQIVGTELFLKAGADLDFATNPSLDVTVTVDDATVGASPDVVADFTLTVVEAPGADPSLYELDDDLDGSGGPNSADGDIDGDGIANTADRFAYDALNGTLLTAGDVIEIRASDVEAGSSPFSMGFRGVLNGTAITNELNYGTNNGAQVVDTAGGKRLQFQTTTGDTGSSNNPQQNFTFGAAVNDEFTFEGVFDNPAKSGTGLDGNFDQYGLIVGLDSAAFVKFVAGSPGAPGGGFGFELSQKGGANPPKVGLSAVGQTIDGFDQVKLEMEATKTATGYTIVGYATFITGGVEGARTAIGTPLTVGSQALIDALNGTGAEKAAFGVTSTNTGNATPFTVSLESLTLSVGDAPAEENVAPTLAGPAAVSVAEGGLFVADFDASDANAGDTLTFGLTGSDADLFVIDPAGALSFKTAPDFEAPADQGGNNVYDVAVTVSDGVETVSKAVTVTVTDADEQSGGGTGPGDDLDGDTIVNSADGDIDGDGVANTTDPFYYDSATDGHGMALADGQTVRLDFDVDGTPFQNGLTGVMQGTTTSGGYQKDTGAGTVQGGKLVVQTTSGDTGGSNDIQNAYNFGVTRDGGFTVETVIDNPFDDAAKSSYKQLGLAVGLDSTDFLKFVAGNVGGAFEFSYRSNDAETKVTANLPSGWGLFGSDGGSIVEKLKLVIAVDVDGNGNATATATATILDANGVPVGAPVIATAPLDLVGDLELALADPASAVGVGVVHTHGTSNQPFSAAFEYIEVKANGIALGGPSDIALSGNSVQENVAGAVIGTVAVTEPDGDAVTLSVGDARFEIVGNQLKLKAGQALDFEVASAISVDITATDKDGSITESLAIGVQNDPSDDQSTSVFDILDAATGVTRSDTYAAGTVGSAVLTILPGQNNVQTSNFGASSFQFENTGDKKIAALFLDVSGAIYADSVFDDDGSGGDNVSKDFSFAGGSDASALSPSGYEHFFLAARTGFDPLFASDKQDSGEGADGGWRGLLPKFGEAGGGFVEGDTAAFAGDMDPNSIAGLLKTTVDTGAIPNWDVGGISGAELIGSTITVMFSDGTFAQGELFSDDSQAGSQALITQAVDLETAPAASLTVNGVSDGGLGTYGGGVPSVIVEGPVGATVRVVMTKGFDPVGNNKAISDTTANQLVADRLDAYAFKASNAAEFQAIDVKIPASGSIDVGALFAYNNAPNGNPNVPDFAKLQLGFAAAVINTSSNLPLGPVSDPVYLANNGQVVVGGATTPPDIDPPAVGTEGYFQATQSGSNVLFKAQFEDTNVLGDDPGGLWSFLDAPDENGNQNGFQGSGYYLWGAEDNTGLNNTPAQNSFVPFTVLVPEGQGGNYTLRLRVSRDAGSPSGEQNDVWVKIDNDAEALIANNPNDYDLVSSNGFIKLFGGGTGGWSYATGADTVSESQPNLGTVQFTLPPGLHTITFAGRSQGFHLDFWELYKGSAPSVGAANSAFVATGPTVPTVADPIDDATIVASTGGTIAVPAGTFADLDGDTLTLEAAIPGALQSFVSFNAATKVFTVAAGGPQGTYAIGVTATDDDGNSVTDTFDVRLAMQPAGPSLTFSVLNGATTVDGDLNGGDSYAAAALGASPKFSGVFESGSAASVVVQLLNGQGAVIGTATENVTPYDFTYSGPALGAGSYTLKAVSYSGTSGSGQVLATQEFAFQVTGGGAPANRAPTVANPLGTQTFAEDSPFSFGVDNIFVDPDGDTVALSAVGLPNGVTLSNGVISGTAANDGDFNVTVTASDGKGGTASTSFLLDITDVPGGTGPTTVSSSIGTSAGDWEQFGGASSQDLEFGLNGTTPQWVGLRFAGLNIPDGATIGSAKLVFQAYETSTGAANYTIAVEDADAAAAYTTANLPGGRSYLAEKAAWSDVESWIDGGIYESADLAGLVQDVVDKHGATNVLGFLVTGTGSRAAEAFDAPGAAPMLVVSYYEEDQII